MKCWRFNLKQNAAKYLNGELSADKTREVEAHLLDCERCREIVARVQSGHRLASFLSRETSDRDSWVDLETALDTVPVETRTRFDLPTGAKRILTWRLIPAAAALIAVALFLTILFINR